MRNIMRIVAAILAALAVATWQLVNGVWRLVRSALVPPPPHVDEREVPVTEAKAAAEQILTADKQAKAGYRPGRDGVRHRYPLGVALAMAARGFEEYVSEIPPDLRPWLYSLDTKERELLGSLAPDQIEAHLAGAKVIDGLPVMAELHVCETALAQRCEPSYTAEDDEAETDDRRLRMA